MKHFKIFFYSFYSKKKGGGGNSKRLFLTQQQVTFCQRILINTRKIKINLFQSYRDSILIETFRRSIRRIKTIDRDSTRRKEIERNAIQGCNQLIGGWKGERAINQANWQPQVGLDRMTRRIRLLLFPPLRIHPLVSFLSFSPTRRKNLNSE